MAKGKVIWVDLTVDDAVPLRDFYAAVLGWTPEGLAMDGYDDYVMKQGDGPVAGVCHRRGPNADLPPQWIVYFGVEDQTAAVREAEARGATLLKSTEHYALLRDPAGAVFAVGPT